MLLLRVLDDPAHAANLALRVRSGQAFPPVAVAVLYAAAKTFWAPLTEAVPAVLKRKI